MKRYLMETRKRYIEEDYCEMVERPDGYWVKYEDVEKLEARNGSLIDYIWLLIRCVDNGTKDEQLVSGVKQLIWEGDN